VIVEGIVTTLRADGSLNIAPMGPTVDGRPDWSRLLLRPFQSSTTYRNLRDCGEGDFHVTDDVLLLAQTAIGAPLDPYPATRDSSVVRGKILEDACRYVEFRVESIDDREDRTTIVARTVGQGRIRDFFGFNRAKHAVVEAAILATRTSLLPLDSILADFQRLEIPVEKTGGPAERAAFELLHRFVRQQGDRALAANGPGSNDEVAAPNS
jgi:hypothetical protein